MRYLKIKYEKNAGCLREDCGRLIARQGDVSLVVLPTGEPVEVPAVGSMMGGTLTFEVKCPEGHPRRVVEGVDVTTFTHHDDDSANGPAAVSYGGA